MEKSVLELLDEYKNGLRKGTTGCRTGARICFLRSLSGLSRRELGTKTGLDQNRVLQYENGRRNPKAPLLDKFAEALGVDSRVLEDPRLSSAEGVMSALFEMELLYGLKAEQRDGRVVLTFSRDASEKLNIYLTQWARRLASYSNDQVSAKTDEEIDAVVGQYSRWKFEFPGSVIPVDPKAERIEQIKTEIEALKRQLKELGEKSG